MKYVVKILFFLFVFLNFTSYSQEVNPNGYNIFYYPNGFKLSEGNLLDGKPNGYWITYYVNGQKKSEGNRKNFLLDSVWIFYAENGDTTEKITYFNGLKNGIYNKYNTKLDTVGKNIIYAKEIYVDDKKQGYSYYYKNEKLHYKIKFLDNYKHGDAYEFDNNGVIIAIEEYRYGNIISRKAINRINQKGEKNGSWVEFHENGKIKSEINFISGMPNGTYKEFTPTGTIAKIEVFENGKVINTITKPKYDSLQSANIITKKEYYDNKKIKAIRNYKDSLPFGVHTFYKIDGSIEKVILYNEFGIRFAEGLMDTLSKKQGAWNYYYDNDTISYQGNFIDDKKYGEWTFYYRSGKISQIGYYENDFPEKTWKMYYESSSLWRLENYETGIKIGQFFELSPIGDTIVKGSYEQNDPNGIWFYKIGDEYEIGKYSFAQKTGTWKTYYYPSMVLKAVEIFSENRLSGKYIEYYPNKKLKIKGEYSSGKQNNKWEYYYEDGSLNCELLYKFGEIVKINDIPIN